MLMRCLGMHDRAVKGCALVLQQASKAEPASLAYGLCAWLHLAFSVETQLLEEPITW